MVGVAAIALVATLTACASSKASGGGAGGGGSGSSAVKGARATTVAVGALSNGAATEVDLSVPEVASIRTELPKSVQDKGTLVIGLGLLPTGAPPLGFTGSDRKTLTGSEPDLSRLVAAVLGLKPQLDDATWDNLFVGIDSGKTDAGFSNITDTEQRKTKYDFACYRQDNLGFEVLKSSNWNFAGNYQNLAGQTVAVSSGTNQEKILLEVLPGSELHLPGAGFGQDHRVLHAEPVDRLSRPADREHAQPNPIRRQILRCRSLAAGPDLRHDQEG